MAAVVPTAANQQQQSKKRNLIHVFCRDLEDRWKTCSLFADGKLSVRSFNHLISTYRSWKTNGAEVLSIYSANMRYNANN